MKTLRVVIAGFVFLSAGALAFAGRGTGADFLKVPTSARFMGLGQSGMASMSDVDALNVNSAGILSQDPDKQKKYAAGFNHQTLFQENTLDQVGLIAPFKGAALGLNLVRLSYASQDQLSSAQSNQGSFHPSDTAVGLSGATVFKSYRLGAQLKWIAEDIGSDNANGFAFDFGAISPVYAKRYQLGLAINNVGPAMKFVDQSYKLPLSVTLGSTVRVVPPLSMSLDLVSRPYDESLKADFGAEYTPVSAASLRVGYAAILQSSLPSSQKGGTTNGSTGSWGGFSGGFGFRIKAFRFDYAFAPFGELGSTQLFTVAAFFGASDAGKVQSPNEPQKPSEAAAPDRSAVIFEGDKPAAATPAPAVTPAP